MINKLLVFYMFETEPSHLNKPRREMEKKFKEKVSVIKIIKGKKENKK